MITVNDFIRNQYHKVLHVHLKYFKQISKINVLKQKNTKGSEEITKSKQLGNKYMEKWS
jgi:hypothetical protein